MAELVEGARYVMGNSILRLIVLFAFFLSLSGQSIAAIGAAVAFRLYGHDAEDNAWLITALGIGALVMSVYVLLVAARFRRTVLTKVGIAIYAVGLALIPLTTNFGVGLIAYGDLRTRPCPRRHVAQHLRAGIGARRDSWSSHVLLPARHHARIPGRRAARSAASATRWGSAR